MKNILFQILKVVLFPLIWCHRVIMDAPIICCDDTAIGFGESTHFSAESRSYASGSRDHGSRCGQVGWVCHAR